MVFFTVLNKLKMTDVTNRIDDELDYYKTYYSEFLEIRGRDFTGNTWLAFAKWLLARFGKGTIENPTEEGLVAWNTFYKQLCNRSFACVDVLLDRANDNVQRRSLLEPEMPRNEGYEMYKLKMEQRMASATAYKKHTAALYKGFLSENNIITMGAEDCDFMTQREWIAAEEAKAARNKWLTENKDRFVVEAFAELDKAIDKERVQRRLAIDTATDNATSWDLPIPESKKDQEALAKKIKADWRFKDAVSGLKAADLRALLEKKITEHKQQLHESVVMLTARCDLFESHVKIWTQYRTYNVDELKNADAELRRQKPVLTSEGVRVYNDKIGALNQQLKIIAKLIQMNERGIRCMDTWKGYNDGYMMYFEF